MEKNKRGRKIANNNVSCWVVRDFCTSLYVRVYHRFSRFNYKQQAIKLNYL